MDIRKLSGAKIAIILMAKDEHGDDDWAILKGTGLVEEGALYIHRGPDEPLFPVPAEALDRVKEVTEELSDMLLGAQYCIPITIGRVDEDIDPRTLASAGFVWPK